MLRTTFARFAAIGSLIPLLAARGPKLISETDPYTHLKMIRFDSLRAHMCKDDHIPDVGTDQVSLIPIASQLPDGKILFAIATKTYLHDLPISVPSGGKLHVLVGDKTIELTAEKSAAVYRQPGPFGGSWIEDDIFTTSKNDILQILRADHLQFRIEGERYVQRCVDAKALANATEFTDALPLLEKH